MRHVSAILGLLVYTVLALEYHPFDKSQLSEESIFEQFDYPSLADSPWKVSRAKNMMKEEMKSFNIRVNGQLKNPDSIRI